MVATRVDSTTSPPEIVTSNSNQGKYPDSTCTCRHRLETGPAVAELAERRDVAEKRIHNWSARFAWRPFPGASYRERRSGRPATRAGAARDAFLEDLEQARDELGDYRRAGYPTPVGHHLWGEYGVEYSLGHV